ncbi:MAG: hypothetical protein ABIH88_03170 [Patescibacteria group bacterium]|nr:hypothetical protein [Patescibacteria group bacterium]
MAKKRKTKKQKIATKKKLFEPSQEAISISKTIPKSPKKPNKERGDDKGSSSEYKLIKKDLLKSLLITIGIISLEIVLYLKLR